MTVATAGQSLITFVISRSLLAPFLSTQPTHKIPVKRAANCWHCSPAALGWSDNDRTHQPLNTLWMAGQDRRGRNLGIDAGGGVDPEGRDAGLLRDLLQVAGVAAVEAAHHNHHVQPRRFLRDEATGSCWLHKAALEHRPSESTRDPSPAVHANPRQAGACIARVHQIKSSFEATHIPLTTQAAKSNPGLQTCLMLPSCSAPAPGGRRGR